ncbi:MAG TPA: ABC transporter substrate-binding protein [Candidatus Limnocylindrales bacterium]|nr:ABC transporter substrate-binding protein [Candidatus Limnocylindrales bacterium]
MADDLRPFQADLTRRRFLQGSAVAGVAAFLAACTGTKTGASASPSTPAASTGGGASASTAPSVEPSVAATPKVASGPLKFANWPAYIDLGDADSYTPGASPSLEAFKKQYNVDVDYEEKIGDNATFVETIKPALVGGLATGWDLVVLTDWMAAKIVANGWAEKIDQSNVPNCTGNIRDALKNSSWDANQDFHYPWQSGMTGVGFNAKTLKDNGIKEPTKIADLWDIPSEKVTFLSEARDTFGLVLLKLGVDADGATTTPDQLDQAAASIQPLVDAGLRFTGNEYLQDFGQKKVWAAFVWSGDLASSGGEDDKFIFPEEGTLIWTDNMLIPKGAANKYTAELMMNYVYDPKVAAAIADYVFYVSPVKGADAEIKTIDPDAATNPLLFPPADVVAKQHSFQALSEENEAKLNDLYAKLSGT